MKKSLVAILPLALVFCVAANDAHACGESLFHSGNGMRYQAFITRSPARILVYHPGEVVPGSAASKLYAGLVRAGHKVTVVTDSVSLTRDLSEHRFDVVIANDKDMQGIASQAQDSGQRPGYMVVRGEHSAPDPRFPICVGANDGVNSYLKNLEQMMRQRGA